MSETLTDAAVTEKLPERHSNGDATTSKPAGSVGSDSSPMDRLEARIRQYSERSSASGDGAMSKPAAEPPVAAEPAQVEIPKEIPTKEGMSLSESERERFLIVSNAVRGVFELCLHHQEERVRDVAAVLRSVVDQIRILDQISKDGGGSLAEPERERFTMVSNAIRGVYELSLHHQEEKVRDAAAVLRSIVDQLRSLDEALSKSR